MYWIRAFLLAITLTMTVAQSNPNFLQGSVLGSNQLNAAFAAKGDAVNGIFSNPSITGGTLTSPIIAGTIGGSAITVIPSGGVIAQTLAQSQGGRVVTLAGAVTAATTDHIIEVNKIVGAATTINLPACNANAGLSLVIVDGKGDATVNNITLSPSAGNINGSVTFSMNFSRQAETVWYDGTQCVVFP